MITSPKARDAFDLGREPESVRERYGAKDAKYIYGNDPVPTVPWPGDKFLLARRLVEAGVSVVTMRVSPWDHHGKVVRHRQHLHRNALCHCRCWTSRSTRW